MAHLPTVASNTRYPAGFDRWPRARCASLPEPQRTPYHPLWYPCTGKAIRRTGSDGCSLAIKQDDRSARHPSLDRFSPAARGRRHQHDPWLVGARLARYYQHLRGDRSRDQGQGSRQLRRQWRPASNKVMANPARPDGVPAWTVENYVLQNPRGGCESLRIARLEHINVAEPYSTGLPGRIKLRRTPLWYAQASSTWPSNSGPWSTVIDSGRPRRSASRSSTATTRLPVIEVSTSSTRHSRL